MILQGAACTRYLTVVTAPVGQLVGSTIRSAPSSIRQRDASGKAAVVADIHADTQPADVVDRERPIARRREAIDAQEGQVNLAISRDDAVRADQRQALKK